MKNCIICGDLKPLTDYYAHKKMSDGHLNKCKTCCKQQADEREKRLRQDNDFVEKEKERHRLKYYRLNYKEKHRHSPEYNYNSTKKYRAKNPEKHKATTITKYMKPKIKGNHLHHWSYNTQHYKDVLELAPKDHYLLHRHIKYDQNLKMYRDINGKLLESKQSHLALLTSLSS